MLRRILFFYVLLALLFVGPGSPGTVTAPSVGRPDIHNKNGASLYLLLCFVCVFWPYGRVFYHFY